MSNIDNNIAIPYIQSGYRRKIWFDRGKNLINPYEYLIDGNSYDIKILEKFKEKNNMIESLNVVRKYKDNREKYINDKYSKIMRDINEEDETIHKFNELVDNFKASMKELYQSQFPEKGEEATSNKINQYAINEVINSNDLNYGYRLNSLYSPEKWEKINKKAQKELRDLYELCDIVEKILSICNSKEEIEEEFIKYGIYKSKKDKKLDLIYFEEEE